MLISFKVKNFLSIENEIFIDFRASGSRQLPKNLQKYKMSHILKSIGIYGANASGKSNIIRAFHFVWELTKFSHSYNIDSRIRPTQFKLSTKRVDEPSRFELTFTKKGYTYEYGFSCLNSKIVDEYLYRWDDSYKKPRKSTIFIRRNSNEFDFKTDKSRQELIRSQVPENVLYLSRSTALNYEKVRDVYEFITSDLVITFNNPWNAWGNYTKIAIATKKEIRDKIVEIMQRSDFGGIDDLSVEKHKGKSIGFHADFSKIEAKIDTTPIVDSEVYVTKFIHKDSNGREVAFEEFEESAGTLKMFSMLGPILDILENGKVLIIDELESSLHPNVAEFVVKLFHSKLNKKNAQLLFVSHNTNLLSRGILRRDQILITQRKPNEGTRMYSLSNFNLREGIDFERAYLNGRVGGIPFIDESILD